MCFKFLHDFVESRSIPNFNEFVNNNMDNVIAASIEHADRSPDQLFSSWRQLFALEMKKLNKTHLFNKSIGFNKQKWIAIKDGIVALDHTRAQFKIEGVKALGDTASSSRLLLAMVNDNTSKNDTLSAGPSVGDAQQYSQDTIDDSYAYFSSESGHDHRELELHRLAYKKMIDGQPLANNELAFLRDMKFEQETIKSILQKLVSQTLVMDSCSNIEEEMMKLHLSGVINLINPTMSNTVISALPDELKAKLEYKPVLSELDPNTLTYIEKVIELGSNVDNILDFIMTTKIELIRDHKRDSQQYINISIIEQIINNLHLWVSKQDESEVTFYRRFASILDVLLKDTGIILADGETILRSTKSNIGMNKALFNTGDLSQVYGRKIDLVMKCCPQAKIDISTNEWKKSKVSKGIKLHQQSKNLRLNSSNLFDLWNKFGLDMTIAMDFVGNNGYLYVLRILDDESVVVAHLVTSLHIPSSIESLVFLQQTLQGLLTLKTHLLSAARKIKSELTKAEHNALLQDICEVPPVPSCAPKSPFIFFSPRSNRVQKRQFFEISNDDQA